ncbi:MAG: phospholipid carrier-dependent glycosyltransferase [Bacillota bacterium]
MKRKTRSILIFAAVFVALFVVWPDAGLARTPEADTVNLVQNPSFEQTDADTGLPEGWNTDAWLKGENDSVFSVETADARDGQNCVHIENVSANDARFIQTIQVEPDTLYRLSAYIKASDVPKGNTGASFGVMDMKGSLLDVDDTFGEWQHFEFYGRTGGQQTEMTIALRLGGYSHTTTGKAWFDNVLVEQIDKLPEGVTPVSLESSYQDPGDSGKEKTQQELIKQPQAHASIILLSALWVLFCYALVKRFFKKKAIESVNTNTKPALTNSFIIALTVALLVRMVLAATVYGFETDMNCFKGWAAHLASTGPWGFYGSIFADYPPGYMYVLMILGWIQSIFGIAVNSSLFTLIIKLPAIFADMALAYFVYTLAARRMGTKWAFALSMLIAFNPASILNTSLWGQIDSILALLLVLCAHSLLEKRILKACLIFTVALLIKPQTLLFAPVILFVFIHDYMTGEKRQVLKKIGISVGASLLLFIAAIIPFWGSQQPFWIVERYLSTATSYPYATINAFNLFGLFGANWVEDTQIFFLFSYKVWGYIFIAAVLLASAILFFKKPDRRKIYLVAAFIIIGVFTLGHNMHERYLYPAVFLLIMAYFTLRDRRILYMAMAFTVTLLFNAGVVLALGNIPGDDIALRIASFVQVALFAWFAYICFDICIRNRIRAFQPDEEPEIPPEDIRAGIAMRREEKPGWKKKDMLLAGGLTLVYAIIALINLGSTSVPQTYWRAQDANATATIRFDGEYTVTSMRYFGGIANGAATVQLVDGAGNAVSTATLDQEEGSMYTWVTLEVKGEAAGAVIKVDTPDIWLIETAFYDIKGNRIPIAHSTAFYDIKGNPVPEAVAAGNASDAKSSAAHLTDEQNLIPELPTYMDQMYFDEIYHARTAYEHLNGLEFYETTHPPLGKLFISVGIAVFGMNPFGWRIIGTIFGILMVPIMYMFGKRVFKSSRYAFIAAFLFAFDCMHFVQTRIATIDVYGVFFIILMFYEMYRYYTTSFYNQPLKDTLKPLLLCGIFFGLGIASKWIGLYAGAGLAFLFFLSLYNRYKEKRFAEAMLQGAPDAPDAYLEKVRSMFRPAAIRTLLAAAVFFIVIPLGIYIASYIPILMAHEGNYAFSDLWGFQTFMFNYHSYLTATHPFSSQWWSWPVDARPIWYYAGSGLPAGEAASIAAFGNIAVWWGGLVSSVWLMIRAAGRKISGDPGKLVVLVALASSFLPWVLVTRATFIYHYFASVPFIILATVYLIRYIERRYPRFKWAVMVYLILVAIVFVFFYPAMSGMAVPGWYAHLQEIMPSWAFYYQ